MGGKSKNNLSDSKASFNLLNRDAEIINKSIDHFWLAGSTDLLERHYPN